MVQLDGLCVKLQTVALMMGIGEASRNEIPTLYPVVFPFPTDITPSFHEIQKDRESEQFRTCEVGEDSK